MSEVSTNSNIHILEEDKKPIIILDESQQLLESTVIDFNTDELNEAYEEYSDANKNTIVNDNFKDADILYNINADEPLPPLPDNNIIKALINIDNIPPPTFSLSDVEPDVIVSLNDITKEQTIEEQTVEAQTVKEQTVEEHAVEAQTVEAQTVEEQTVEEHAVKETNNIINNNFEECYGRLVDLVQGTTYDLQNWTLLIIKTLKCVSFVKGLSAESQISLALEIIIFYLDNNTNINDEHLSFIKIQAETLCWTIFEQQGIHKKSNNKNNKNMLKIQKRLDSNSKKTDIDMLPSPLQIVNTVINKVEVTIKTRTLTPETFIKILPLTIISIVGMINKYKHFTKSEKKNLIIQSINTIINERIPQLFKLNENQTQDLELFKVSLPQVVETCIGIANGDTDFNVNFNKPETIMKVSAFVSVLSTIFPCFGKK
jgi:hypothetical protein